MAIKVQYRGYDLIFEEYPTPSAIQAAFEAARARIRGKIRKSDYDSIRPVEREGELPLSFAQEWLWSVDQLMPGSPAYNLPIAMRLAGPLNVAALEQSINEIIRRHEVLRTGFPARNGRPVQVIAPAVRLRLEITDLREAAAGQGNAAAQRIVSQEVQRPFDLASAPLLRARLLRLADDDHVVFIMVHHIVSDAWSTGVLIGEITALYTAYCDGGESPLPELPIQYADFAYWQRQQLQGESLERLSSYWARQLAGAPPVLSLPTDRPRPPIQTFKSARHTFALPGSLSDSIRAFSRSEGVTLFMTLLAAFQTLLYRYGGQRDIVVGSPIAGRSRAETEGLIGCFINTLPLRTDLSGNPRFRDLLGQVRETTLGAYAHQDMPFERIVSVIQPERSSSYLPLFQVLFDLINTPAADPVEVQDVTLSPLDTDMGAAKLDLLMGMWEGEGLLHGFIDYKTDLFDSPTILRMLGSFETLLAAIVAKPDARLDSLELMPESEKRRRALEQKEREEIDRTRFMQVRPKPVKVPADSKA